MNVHYRTDDNATDRLISLALYYTSKRKLSVWMEEIREVVKQAKLESVRV